MRGGAKPRRGNLKSGKMKKIFTLFLIVLILCANAMPLCAKSYKNITPLEVRAMQNHIYPTTDTKKVFKATINTLQDNGFTIINVEDTLGYINAKKEFKAKMTDKKRVVKDSGLVLLCLIATAATYGAFAPYVGFPVKSIQNEITEKPIIMDVNADIQPEGDTTRVRVIMVEKILENADGYSRIKSSPRKVIRIYNPLVYQEFFNQLGKSIFYEESI